LIRPLRWSPTVVALHWINAALMLALLVLGWAMTHRLFGAATTFDLYQTHKSLGFGALALTALRVLARSRSRAPAPVPGPEGRLARAVQAAFYVLTLLAIAAGWLVVSTSPLPIPTRFFDLFVIPNIAPPDAGLFSAALLAHRLAAYAIAALVALHVAGALKHQWVDRDGTLGRMTMRGPDGRGFRGRRRGAD
jgi:cytochrome b561